MRLPNAMVSFARVRVSRALTGLQRAKVIVPEPAARSSYVGSRNSVRNQCVENSQDGAHLE